MPDPFNPSDEPAPPAPPVDVEESRSAFSSEVYKEYSNKQWTKAELQNRATSEDEFSKLVKQSPFAKQIDEKLFNKIDSNGSGDLEINELENARRSGKLDKETTKATDELQKLIHEHPKTIYLEIGNRILPTFPQISKEMLFGKEAEFGDDPGPPPAPPVEVDESKSANASAIYKQFENKNWTLKDLQSMATSDEELKKLIEKSPFTKQISPSVFNAIDENKSGDLEIAELENAHRSGKFSADTVKALDGLQKLLHEHPGNVYLSIGDKVMPSFQHIPKAYFNFNDAKPERK